MKKNISIIILTIIMCLLPLFFISVSAQSSTYYTDVFDYANLLTEEEEQELMAIALNYSEKIQGNVIYLTYDKASGYSTMTYTDDFYDNLLFNETLPCEDGILFAIDMDNREVYINTVGSCIDKLSDYKREEILDETCGYLSNNNYFMYLKTTSTKCMHVISGEFDPAILVPSLGSLGLSTLFTIIVIIVLKSKHNKANIPISTSLYANNSAGCIANNFNTQFVNEYTTIQRNYYAQSSSGSSRSGSSSHRSSGGVRHGGGGRRF